MFLFASTKRKVKCDGDCGGDDDGYHHNDASTPAVHYFASNTKPATAAPLNTRLPPPQQPAAASTMLQGETYLDYVWRVYVVGYASTIADHLPEGVIYAKHEKE